MNKKYTKKCKKIKKQLTNVTTYYRITSVEGDGEDDPVKQI